MWKETKSWDKATADSDHRKLVYRYENARNHCCRTAAVANDYSRGNLTGISVTLLICSGGWATVKKLPELLLMSWQVESVFKDWGFDRLETVWDKSTGATSSLPRIFCPAKTIKSTQLTLLFKKIPIKKKKYFTLSGTLVILVAAAEVSTNNSNIWFKKYVQSCHDESRHVTEEKKSFPPQTSVHDRFSLGKDANCQITEKLRKGF